MPPGISRILLPLLAAATVACGGEAVPEAFRPTRAHETYGQRIEADGLARSALASDWDAAADAALDDPVAVDLPFREIGFLDPRSAQAVGYRFTALPGQRIEAELEVQTEPRGEVFADLFRVSGRQRGHVASASRDDGRLAFEARSAARYVLRLQPELLRGARYRLTLAVAGSLVFPVQGKDSGAIVSDFGADRDSGARRHRGVDILADRGTPVLASVDGVVRRVGETPRGGRTIWLGAASRPLVLYYAHLASYRVREGQRVSVGAPIGRVGNSGNARFGAPHLHFAIQALDGRAVDPSPFLRASRIEPAAVAVQLDLLGDWTRTRAAESPLRERPIPGSRPRGLLPGHTPTRLLAGSGHYWRVRLPDGAEGYVAEDDLETADEPVAVETLASARRVLARPHLVSAVMEVLEPGARVRVLGHFNGFPWVELPGERSGWLQPDA